MTSLAKVVTVEPALVTRLSAARHVGIGLFGSLRLSQNRRNPFEEIASWPGSEGSCAMQRNEKSD